MEPGGIHAAPDAHLRHGLYAGQLLSWHEPHSVQRKPRHFEHTQSDIILKINHTIPHLTPPLSQSLAALSRLPTLHSVCAWCVSGLCCAPVPLPLPLAKHPHRRATPAHSSSALAWRAAPSSLSRR